MILSWWESTPPYPMPLALSNRDFPFSHQPRHFFILPRPITFSMDVAGQATVLNPAQSSQELFEEAETVSTVVPKS